MPVAVPVAVTVAKAYTESDSSAVEEPDSSVEQADPELQNRHLISHSELKSLLSAAFSTAVLQAREQQYFPDFYLLFLQPFVDHI